MSEEEKPKFKKVDGKYKLTLGPTEAKSNSILFLDRNIPGLVTVSIYPEGIRPVVIGKYDAKELGMSINLDNIPKGVYIDIESMTPVNNYAIIDNTDDTSSSSGSDKYVDRIVLTIGASGTVSSGQAYYNDGNQFDVEIQSLG